MLHKITALFLVCMFSFSTWVSAQAGAEITVLEKLSAVETALDGKTQTGAIMDRIVKLEQDFYGEKKAQSMVERVDFLYDGMFTNVSGQPSTLAKLNAVEWSILHYVTDGSVRERVENMETMLDGHPQTGAFQSRILALGNLSFPGGLLELQEETVPADTLIKIKITSPLSSKTSLAGDTVTYQVDEDVILNGTLVFAKGAEGSGAVSKVSKAQNFGRDAKLEVSFDRVSAADGSTAETFLGEKAQQEMEQMALAAGASIAGMVLLGPVGIVTGAFVKGKNITIPEGAEMYIQTRTEQTVYGVPTGAAALE